MRLDRLNLLIVDDNRHARLLLAQIVRAVGVSQISEAADGGEGLGILRDRPIDIVLTDLEMAPMDGVAFVQAIRRSPSGRIQLTPVIMITGHATATKLTEARDAGVNEFMAKPIVARAVLERLKLIIDHPRPFIRCAGYFGPDRRRRRPNVGYRGPWRRNTDPLEI